MEDRHPRGVFEPEFTGPGGHPMFVAIDSDGHLVAHVSVTDPARKGEILAAFRSFLALLDAKARLTLLQ